MLADVAHFKDSECHVVRKEDVLQAVWAHVEGEAYLTIYLELEL